MTTIGIIGSGFVGTTIGKGFRKLGYRVLFYDIIDKRLPSFSKDIKNVIKNSDTSFVCVPTPTKNEVIDLTYIQEAMIRIGQALASRPEYYIVTIKSTVLPGTTRNTVIPILEKYSRKKVGEFGVCVNPEFITEIEHTWTENKLFKKNFFSEDRIVIGEYDKTSGDVLEEIYRPLNKQIFRTELEIAEMVKYASNCMLATKISYWNEIFQICKKMDIDSNKVSNIASLDPRIGKYGTVHGKAFGGKCLQKDLKAFISYAKKYYEPQLLSAVDKINEEMKIKYGIRE